VTTWGGLPVRTDPRMPAGVVLVGAAATIDRIAATPWPESADALRSALDAHEVAVLRVDPEGSTGWL
jgi:hypothetical protein